VRGIFSKKKDHGLSWASSEIFSTVTATHQRHTQRHADGNGAFAWSFGLVQAGKAERKDGEIAPVLKPRPCGIHRDQIL